MAQEISITAKLSVLKGYLAFPRSAQYRVDMAGENYSAGAMNIPTTAAGTALDMGSIGTAGWGYFTNTDATNYAELGIQTGGTFFPFAKLKPGESAVVRLGTNAPYARANTAAVALDYLILED